MSNEAVLAELRATFRGPLLRPRDGEYQGVRKVWNGAIAGAGLPGRGIYRAVVAERASEARRLGC